jgi:hypothetical protein
MADTFTIVRTTEDPLAAERLVEVLREEKIDAFTRARGAAASAFEPATPGFWELFVPQADLARAGKLIDDELAAIEKEGEENARAAEEESMSGETPTES